MRQPVHFAIFPLIFVSGAALGVFAAPASAQNALGGGRALDANTGHGTGGINQPSGVTTRDYRSRNLIVTGDVIGGRGFEGAVGYSAANDFRGQLGSNDLFRFRAESAGSTLPFLRNQSSSSRLRSGAELGGVVGYERSGTGATLSSVRSNHTIRHRNNLLDTQIEFDRADFDEATPTGYFDSASPRTAALYRDRSGRLARVSASSLRGLDSTFINSDPQTYGLRAYDMMELADDRARGIENQLVGKAFDPSFEAFNPSQREETDQQTDQQSQPDNEDAEKSPRKVSNKVDLREKTLAVNTRVDPDSQSGYAEVMKKIIDRYADREGVNISIDQSLLASLDEDVTQLRQRLRGRRNQQARTESAQNDLLASAPVEDDFATDADNDSALPGKMGDPLPGELLIESSDTQRRVPGRQGRDPRRKMRRELMSKEYGTFLRHGTEIQSYGTQDEDRYNELIRAAQNLLQEGEYFKSENRFERALRYVPNQPLAMAGQANAQIGSGLYLSAALSLRDLFRKHPEMIDTRYAEDLLPNNVRLTTAIDEIRELRLSGQDRFNYDLVQAYIGHQLRDRARVKQSLGAMDVTDPDDPLVKLLKNIWLEEDTDSKKPSSETDDG